MPEMDMMDRKLLNLIQSAFPLLETPYLVIAGQLNVEEQEVIDRLAVLRQMNVVRQISAIFDTRRLGYKTSLVAFAYDPKQLNSGALKINEHPGVSHNYAREGSFYNLWFTIAVPPNESIEKTVEKMAQETNALSMRVMPTIRFFKIGVNFDMIQERGAANSYSPDGYNSSIPKSDWNTPISLTDFDICAIRELQEDLDMTHRPFDGMAERLGISLQDLFGVASSFQERGIMRRYSAVLHHRRAGFSANAMVVWQVPGERAEEVGMLMAAHSAVTHCYERPTFADWPYNHFTMIHATSEGSCKEIAKEISGTTGINDYQLLFSSREYKKTRVRYFV